MLLARLVICCLTVALCVADEEVRVDIPNGSLKGLQKTTVLHNKPYYSFKGIPYAKPNVGSSRFQDPKPAEPWTGEYDATEHKANCVFFCLMRQQVVGEEDCLHLNVYTPDLNKEAGNPVMVWFHGGGFNQGSANDDLYGPDFLVEQGVVVVTMNYRLGAAGFLSTGDANAPGNAGLKDQVLALKWVQENIQNFGGCPKRVTIFGWSAGAASVQFHMMSPMSQDLFSHAIMQSGSAFSSWSITYTPKEVAFMVGNALGIETTDTRELVAKLQEVEIDKLLMASLEVNKHENNMNGHMFTFMPAIEADVGQEVFLPDDPWVLIKSGKLADVPCIVGVTQDEAMINAILMLENVDYLNENFENVIPSNLNVTDPGQRKMIADSIREFYFRGKPITKDALQEYSNLCSDLIVTCGTQLSAAIMSSRNSAPVYNYLFSYDGAPGVLKNLPIFPKVEKGVLHGDEMAYEFYSNFLKNLPKTGSTEEKIMNAFTKMWTNFAKDGNPTSTMDNDVTVAWEPMGEDGNYMDINAELSMKKKLLAERVDFWAQLYKDILGDYSKLKIFSNH